MNPGKQFSLVEHLMRSPLTWQENLEAGKEMIKRSLKQDMEGHWVERSIMIGELLSNQAGRAGWIWRGRDLDFKKCHISSDSNWKVRWRQGLSADVHFVPICVVFLYACIWKSLEFMCLLHISANINHCLSFEALAWKEHKDATSLRRWQSKTRKAERTKNKAEDSTSSCFGKSNTVNVQHRKPGLYAWMVLGDWSREMWEW